MNKWPLNIRFLVYCTDLTIFPVVSYSLFESLNAPAEANEGMEPRTAKRAKNAAILGGMNLQND